MRNIIRIIVTDAKRVSTNVVAMVMILGLAVIPCLYAWFNIMSNWDPYGPDATKNLQVAVASSDEGIVLEGVELNVGDMIIENLQQNDTIGWVFTDTAEDAIDGVHSGDYYAALIVDDTFSEDILSFLGGDMTHPVIEYYENEKKNAIAPKITGKVKTTVQEEVNSAFVSTMAEILLKASDYMVSVDSDGKVTTSILSKLEDLDDNLTIFITIIESYVAIIESAEHLSLAMEAVTDQAEIMMDTGRVMADSADAAADSAQATVQSMSDMASMQLRDISKQLDDLYTMIDSLMTTIIATGESTATAVRSAKSAVVVMHQLFDTNMQGVTGFDTEIDTCDQDFTKLENDLEALATASETTGQDAAAIWAVTKADLKACQIAVDNLYEQYTYVVAPQLSTSMSSIQTSVNEIKSILNYSADSIDDVSGAMGSYPNMLALGKKTLNKSLKEAREMQSKLQEFIADINDLDQGEQYNVLVALIENDPAVIADFISSPVNLEEEYVYEISNNGSASAPFYIVLSIWVGALILCTIIKTKVEDIPGTKNLKNPEKFFGRYVVYFIMGQIQTLITVLGAILYVGIQCKHMFLFWLACSVTATVFTLLLYSFTYAFGAVGEALAVVLMVVQVAGSGGTFPVEVLPLPFQYLYKYMPFAYSMNAIRECVAGRYENDYWIFLSGLGIYVVVALLNGLLLYYPAKKILDVVEENKEKTGDLLL